MYPVDSFESFRVMGIRRSRSDPCYELIKLNLIVQEPLDIDAGKLTWQPNDDDLPILFVQLMCAIM